MAGKEKDIEGSEENTAIATINNSPPSTTKVDAESSKINLSYPATNTTKAAATSTSITTDTAVSDSPETISCIGYSNIVSKEGNSSGPEETGQGQLSTASAGISLIQLYSESSSSSSSSSDESESENLEETTQSLDHNIDDDTEDCNNDPVGCGNRKYGYAMIAGEVDYRDLSPPKDAGPCLPPLVPLSPIGFVLHTIEQLTIIESYPDKPTVDEGTHLWSDEREYIGEVRTISRFEC